MCWSVGPKAFCSAFASWVSIYAWIMSLSSRLNRTPFHIFHSSDLETSVAYVRSHVNTVLLHVRPGTSCPLLEVLVWLRCAQSIRQCLIAYWPLQLWEFPDEGFEHACFLLDSIHLIFAHPRNTSVVAEPKPYRLGAVYARMGMYVGTWPLPVGREAIWNSHRVDFHNIAISLQGKV